MPPQPVPRPDLLQIDPEVARHARVALDRMLALPGETHKD
jgi:quinolinate synthase